MNSLCKGRSFQLWAYRVSHGLLLVRSPRSPTVAKNVDIMFAGVEYVDLPRHLPELELLQPNERDIACAQERTGRSVAPGHVIIVRCLDRRHIVVAASMKVIESDMDIFESPNYSDVGTPLE